MNDLLLKLHAATKSILNRVDGQSLTEYSLAFSLIALGCVVGQSAIASSVNQTFVAMATTITTNIAR